MGNIIRILFVILFFGPSIATAKATCYVPNHPDICPQIIGLLDKMRSEGKLSVQEWDGITLNVDANNPYFTNSNVSGGEQYGAVFYDKSQRFGFNGAVFNLMSFITGKQDIGHAATTNQLQNFEQGVADQLVLRYWTSSIRIDRFEPNRNATNWQQTDVGIKLNSNYQPSPGAYMAIPTQMSATNLIPVPINTPVLAPSKVPQLAPNQAPPKIAQSVPAPKITQSGNRLQPSGLMSLPQKVHITKLPKDVKIGVENLNQYFITRYAGDHIDRNERAYMMDSDEKVWGCKIAGMTARKTLNDKGEYEMHGHFETAHYKNRFLSHVPAIHGHRQGCLISVHK